MGSVLWIQPENAEPDHLADDLFYLLKESSKIDKLCKKLGVKKLSEFHDSSEIAAEFGHDMPPLISEPAELLVTLNAIESHLEAGAVRLSADTVSELKAELAICVSVVKSCEESGQRVRLVLVA